MIWMRSATMDYGHELQFGAFITPTAAAAQQVVRLAELADRAGLDLVTVQDHPYQPAFLDTWTLLSVIAARTERIRVSPNVANLPLRPPAVLARAAASLDLLSGGRVELGLGAGAFWPAITAMGGPSREPREAVDALREAIGVIRALWTPGSRGVRLPGEHYRLTGAKPGPAPAHDIEIWVGAYKPRMLRLVGEVADGWLPSLAYSGVETLPELNRIIDDAALAAGRRPEQVRRLYNIPAGMAPEQLAELALTHGMSVFIVSADDPNVLAGFAAEVAPAVRELVAKERAQTEGGAERGVPEWPGTPVPVVAEQDGFGVTPTPDDGVRLSRTAAWDESTRPTGPARDPDRRYTQGERARGQHLVDVHDHLRAELAQLRDLMEQVLSGVIDAGRARSHINTMTMRQNNWTLGTYCESYCRLVTTHHTIEDHSMLPALSRADPRLTPVTDRLAAEHLVIHDVIERMDRALVGFVADPTSSAELRDAVDQLTDTLLSHLSYEERELVEPLARIPLY
jgi:alkanesulfonate monooxygenase SsuD/methylene tetrahydromethanopterin reductase-like flavin-dependent oxidoreductase (luciferase family)